MGSKGKSVQKTRGKSRVLACLLIFALSHIAFSDAYTVPGGDAGRFYTSPWDGRRFSVWKYPKMISHEVDASTKCYEKEWVRLPLFHPREFPLLIRVYEDVPIHVFRQVRIAVRLWNKRYYTRLEELRRAGIVGEGYKDADGNKVPVLLFEADYESKMDNSHFWLRLKSLGEDYSGGYVHFPLWTKTILIDSDDLLNNKFVLLNQGILIGII